MTTKEITITYQVADYDELSPLYKSLVDAAREATGRSYAPYSKFNVGAAIALANGEIVTGANQENAAYPSGTCAERTACYYASASFPRVPFEAIAIAARGTNGEFTQLPTPPCGACRQALLEYENISGHPVPLLLAGADKIFIFPSVQSLLPLSFSDFE